MTADQFDPRPRIPGWPNAHRAAERAAQFAFQLAGQSVTTPRAATREVFAALESAAKTGADLPDDLAARVARATAEAECHHVVIAEARRVADHLANEEATVVRRGVDHGLLWLHQQLAALLDEARDLAGAVAANTPDEAFASKDTTAITAFVDLSGKVDDYDAIRRWQRTLVTTAAGGPGSEIEFPSTSSVNRVSPGLLIDVAGEFANLDAIWPEWDHARRGDTVNTIVPAVPAPPWPASDPDNVLRPVYDVRYLKWLTSHPDARPWVPSIGDAAAAYAAARAGVGRRREEAAEIRQYGHVRTPEQRKRDAEEAEAKIRENERFAARYHRSEPVYP